MTAMRIDMRHGFRKPVDHTRRKDAVEIFRIPVRVLSRFYATIDCADRCIPTHFAARVKQGCNDRCGRGEFPVDEQCPLRSAKAGLGHLGIQPNRRPNVWFWGLFRVFKTDAVQMDTPWNPGITMPPSDKPLPT